MIKTVTKIMINGYSNVEISQENYWSKDHEGY